MDKFYSQTKTDYEYYLKEKCSFKLNIKMWVKYKVKINFCKKSIEPTKKNAKAIMSSTGTSASHINVPVSSDTVSDSTNRNNNVDPTTTERGKKYTIHNK